LVEITAYLFCQKIKSLIFAAHSLVVVFHCDEGVIEKHPAMVGQFK